MKILAIETSCDETACAVVQDGTKIISNVIASSAEMHKKYGGIVPEVAARRQLESILPVLHEALSPLESGSGLTPFRTIINDNIDAIAVTVGPGLIGSLLVGVETAKTIAFVTGKPIIPVNHVLAHMYANFLDSDPKNSPRALLATRGNHMAFPAISLVVSGGHTELYLMKSAKELQWLGGTLDDAAGECFDKTARLLGFGHGGGVAIQEAAAKYQIANSKYQTKLPRPMINDKSLNFSFSGLKTATLREGNKLKSSQQFNNATIQQVAFEVQEAITDVLVKKTLRAAQRYEAKSILLSGGVAANQRLREKFSANLRSNEVTNLAFYAPPPTLCTDNAVMIAACANFLGEPIDWQKITAVPDLSVEKITSAFDNTARLD